MPVATWGRGLPTARISHICRNLAHHHDLTVYWDSNGTYRSRAATRSHLRTSSPYTPPLGNLSLTSNLALCSEFEEDSRPASFLLPLISSALVPRPLLFLQDTGTNAPTGVPSGHTQFRSPQLHNPGCARPLTPDSNVTNITLFSPNR